MAVYKLFEIYTHKYSQFVVAENVEEIKQVFKYDEKYSKPQEKKLGDYLIFHNAKTKEVLNAVSVKDYLEKNPSLHSVGWCAFEQGHFDYGEVEIVSEYDWNNGVDVVFLKYVGC